jgi:hypothetical protein
VATMVLSSDVGDMSLVAIIGSSLACSWVLPRLVYCEVEVAVAGSLWCTMTGDRRSVQ